MDEIRIHLRAGTHEGQQGRGRVRIAVGDHASGSVGGFAGRLALLDDDDSERLLFEAQSKRESDDSPADDGDVPVLHLAIVKKRSAISI